MEIRNIREPSYSVYFMQSGHMGPIKIGKAKNVNQRLEHLQIGNPVQLRILATVPCTSEKEAYSLEKKFQRMFVKQHLRGEWYSGDIRLSRIEELGNDRSINHYDLQAPELEIAQRAKAMQ